ncbi:MAG TPA: cyclic nucleotide-binding domain-containing protein [Chloroflexota bacterium]|jgi:CRP-like cAMP-binding protein|nr:cyclic nucleotide-binding domain-containing protein [Chloroflexota bacterium]
MAMKVELRQINIFQDLSRGVLARLAMLSRKRSYPVGTLLTRPGEAVDRLYAILRGQVRVESLDASLPEPIVLAELGPGDVVGEWGLLADGVSAERSVVVEAVQAVELPYSALALALLPYPDVAAALRSALSERGRSSAMTGQLQNVSNI